MARFRFLCWLFSIALLAPLAAQAQMDTSAEHAILMDGATGAVLWQKDAHAPMPPASMSKLMTLDLLFERLKDGRVKLTDTFPVSQQAWATQGSKSVVMVGTRVPVADLIRGIIIQSGNDACIVVAEALGGTVEGFVKMMNDRAKELGLRQSTFVNPDGLPEPPGQLMSAYDLAKLARHIITTFPQYYHFFGERSFEYNGITQENRNLVLEKFPGADGLKTGYTDAAGYGIVTSAVHEGRRLILVLMGLRYPDKSSWWAERYRADEAARLLGVAFREFREYKLFKPEDVVARAKVWHGAADTVALVTGKPLALTMQVESRKDMKISVHYETPVKAPITKGQKLGTLMITAPQFPMQTVPLYAGEAVPEAGFFTRGMQGLSVLFGTANAAQ
jgi:D-alanyl-D-alanine carboxypeptidase (penicillin-binding protein 5/6)